MSEPFRYPFEEQSGLVLHDYQRDSVRRAEALGAQYRQPRLCLYYKTGAGKTLTSLASVKVMGQTTALVIAPPTTHSLWRETAMKLGIEVDTWSHQKFRQPDRKVAKDVAIIVDEFHMLGGYRAQGFKKLERIAGSLQAPVVICSATPNYNDIERCYCIQRIVDRRGTEGGYLSFIYRNCATDVNPWGHVPIVKEFLRYPDAAAFLAEMKNVEYIEDDLEYTIEDRVMTLSVPDEFHTYGVDRRQQRVLGSIMERKHRTVIYMMVGEDGRLTKEVADFLVQEVESASTPVLVFGVHTDVVRAATHSLLERDITAVYVTGKTTPPAKTEAIEAFKAKEIDVLVGTQTLATGTDGLDKVCDLLVILDDTEDNAMRRQLIGRIMPRGQATTQPHSNRVVRLVPEALPGP